MFLDKWKVLSTTDGCSVATMLILSIELPGMERLQLSQVTASSVEEPDESVDEEELQRFKELKHRMILLDKAEQGLIMQSNRRSCPPLAHK